MSNLLKYRFPDLVEMWDHEKNVDLDINTITYGSSKNAWWKCKNGHSWNQRVQSRAIARTVCPTCHSKDRAVIKDIPIVEQQSDITNFTAIGDNTEEYIRGLVVSTNLILRVDRVGYLNGSTDLVVTMFDNSLKSLQVKTLIRRKDRQNSYVIYMSKDKYSQNMVIVMTDQERQRFSIEFAGNITSGKKYFNFNQPRPGMFTDCNQFSWAIMQLIPLSSDYKRLEDINSPQVRLEDAMLARLEQFCIKNKLTFRRHTTSGDTIDCFINDAAIQAKFCSLNTIGGHTHLINTSKGATTIDGRRRTQSYHVNDPFKFLIVEIGGTREFPSKYIGQFCIFPKDELINQNVLASTGFVGKHGFRIGPPDYTKPHWSKIYWNNTSLL
jgi:hypothetical protein